LSSALHARGDAIALEATFIYVSRYIAFLNVALCLILAIFSREILTYWLHKDADPAAVLIVIVVAYTLMVESFSNVPTLVNDGLGKPHGCCNGAELLRSHFHSCLFLLSL
jgi:O-antigen/teichoic acid export membrane protein